MKFFRALLILVLGAWFLVLGCKLYAQEGDLEFTLDANSATIPLPKIFKPNIDLSGRGFNRQTAWPQELAAEEVLHAWQNDIGFKGLYRLQYNFWQIHELGKDKNLQDKLLENYENIIKKISDSGGIVILDIFGTPAGLGRVLDKKSPPLNLKKFKELIKVHIRRLSFEKRYNIWYEVWSAPDLDEFFLGRKQEYLNLYRVVAETAKELSEELKIHIPVGGPSASWWFQDAGTNDIITAERSLIYDLIKFCSRNRLPLDFISWHAYSTDPKAEKETTIYNKNPAALIRDWLSYFNFDRNTPLIIDEWNYDNDANVLSARQERSFIAASYIPSRIKNMYEAGIDYQLYFCLEDFGNNKENVVRNVGIFKFSPSISEYKGSPKPIYNIFKMLSSLGNNMFTSPFKLKDEFAGIIATKTKEDEFAIIIYNYIDTEIVRSYLSRNIAALKGGERKALLEIIKSAKLDKIIAKELDPAQIRASSKVKEVLKKAQDLSAKALRAKSANRNFKLGIKNLKGNYSYQRYAVNQICGSECKFAAIEEKQVSSSAPFQETIVLEPYSVNMVILKKKPVEQPQSSDQAVVQPSQELKSNTGQ